MRVYMLLSNYGEDRRRNLLLLQNSCFSTESTIYSLNGTMENEKVSAKYINVHDINDNNISVMQQHGKCRPCQHG